MNAASALTPRLAPGAAFAAPRRRGFAAGIVLVHGLVIWALMQAPAVRQGLVAAEPVAVRLIAAFSPDTAAPVRSETPVPPAAPSPAAPRRERLAPPAASPPPAQPRADAPSAEPSPSPADLPMTLAAEPGAPMPAPAAAPTVAAAMVPATEPAPVAAPQAPKQIPASAVQYLNRVLPVYSPASVRAREAGRVVARVLIDEAGQPRTVQVQQSSHFVRLDDACAAAVRQSRFKPYTDNGQPTAGWAWVPCDFEL